MGLKADIDEVRVSWSKAPWWVRSYLILSGYLAVSSIASISETVVKWRGFFMDALVFYQQWLSTPVRNLLANTGIHLNTVATDVLVLSLLVCASYLRGEFVETDWKARKDRLSFYFSVILFVAVLASSIYKMNGKDMVFEWQRYALCAVFFVLIPYLFMTKAIRIYFLQLFACFVVVALLAAVNSGLAK